MSEESKTAAQAPEAEGPLPMKLEVRMRPIEPKGNLLGFATLVLNDSFVVDGLKVLNSDKGLYVGMPSVKDERSKTGYRETAKPITSDFRKLLNDAVIGGYHAEVQHLQEKAARIAEGPASIDSQLAKGAEKAAAQPARGHTTTSRPPLCILPNHRPPARPEPGQFGRCFLAICTNHYKEDAYMARGKRGPDGACYYNNKLMGRCTVADSDTYTALLEQCGGSAARVLQEYAYFSPELKAIFEKVADIQAGQSRGGVSCQSRPAASPWGEVQTCDTLCPGVFMVSTAGHGGTMVAGDMQAALSPAARKCGDTFHGYLCFEEDCQESVVLRELLDKGLWQIPDRIQDKAAFAQKLDESIRQYNPDYWRVRQSGLEKRQQAGRHTHRNGAG